MKHDNEDGIETYYACIECETPMEEWVVTTNGAATVHTCPCGGGQWVHMQGPALDLGIVRDEP